MSQSYARPNDAGENLLGVCAAIGEATGISPLFIRIAFVVAMLGISFEMTILAYCVTAVALRVVRR